MKKRLLLKISGEVLAGGETHGISNEVCKKLSKSILSLVRQGHSLALVVGGGNFIRGSREETIPRVPADQMGMLATLMNGIALSHYLSEAGGKVRLLSAFPCPSFVEYYTFQEASRAYEKELLLLVGGTGNPFFTTDSGAALRACELQVDYLLKATKVDGIYSKDPKKYPQEAKRFSKISFTSVLEQNLQVMDATAFALCSGEKVKILVFSIDLLLQGKEVTLEELLQAGSIVE